MLLSIIIVFPLLFHNIEHYNKIFLIKYHPFQNTHHILGYKRRILPHSINGRSGQLQHNELYFHRDEKQQIQIN